MIRVDVVLKIKTDAGLLRPSSVSVPFMPNVPPEYAPSVSVVPPSSTGRAVEVRTSVNGVFASLKAVREPPPSTTDPLVVIDPVGAVAPPTPTSPPAVPEIVLAAALVTPVLARTPYVELDPMVKGVVAANEGGVSTITKSPEAIKKSEATKLAITL